MNLKRIIREEINKGYYIIEDEDGFMLIHYEDLLKVEPHLYKILKYLPTVDFDEARDLYYKFLNNQITESEDDLDWIRDVQPVQHITELKPGDRYKIVEMSGKAEKDYLTEPDLAGLEPGTIFHISDRSNFYSRELVAFNDTWREGFDDVWIANEGSLQCGWVNVNTIMVVKV